MEIWNIIVQSNTFNFLLVVVLLAIIFKKLKVVSKLEGAVDKVKEEINLSDIKKEQSINDLKDADKLYEEINVELSEIEKNSSLNIKALEESEFKEREKTIETIKQNSLKIIESTEKKAVQNLSRKTILASFELAKKHIVKLLDENPQYHQKFIEDSIKELDGLKQ